MADIDELEGDFVEEGSAEVEEDGSLENTGKKIGK
jgi:hypothetical protein